MEPTVARRFFRIVDTVNYIMTLEAQAHSTPEAGLGPASPSSDDPHREPCPVDSLYSSLSYTKRVPVLEIHR